MVGKLKLAWAVASIVLRFLKDLEKQGKARLSPENAKVDRRKIEDALLCASRGNDSGWRALFDLDDAAIDYAQRVMKSRWLEQKMSSARP